MRGNHVGNSAGGGFRRADYGEKAAAAGVVMSGADWKEFCNSGEVFAEDTSWDDTLIFVDGAKVEDDAGGVSDAAVVRVECGYIDRPAAGAPEDLVDCIRWWLARRNTVAVLVRINRGRLEELMAAAAALDATVVVGA